MYKVCINCGSAVTNDTGEAVSKLYDEKLYNKSKIIKLLQCSQCGRVCDKYLEYDGTLLLLDGALQSRPALRHLLINSDYSAVIRKVSLLTLIVDGYCRSGQLIISDIQYLYFRWSRNSQQKQFFEQEFEFYSRVAEALTSLAVFLAVSSFLMLSSSKLKLSVASLYHGLLLAYSTRFLLVVALLFTPTSSFLWTGVEIFFLLTSVSVSRVMTPKSHGHCLALMTVAHLARLATDNLGGLINQTTLCD